MSRALTRLAVVLACVCPTPSVSADTIYFTSKSSGAVLSFDWSNATSGTVTATPVKTGLSSPNGLAMGSDGFLYVTETGSNAAGSITRVATTGQSSAVVGLPGAFPAGVAFLPNGGDMIVSSLSPAEDVAGTVLFRVSGWSGTAASAAPYTDSPLLSGGAAVATGPTGTVFLSNNTGYFGDVVSFTSGSALPTTVISNGSGTSQVAAPTGLVVAGSTLYTLSITDFRLLATDLSSDPLTTITRSTLPAGSFPSALATLSDGRLLVGTANFSGQFFVVNPLDWSYTDFTVSNAGQIGGVVAVPEPGTLCLAAVGASVLGWMMTRRRRGPSVS